MPAKQSQASHRSLIILKNVYAFGKKIVIFFLVVTILFDFGFGCSATYEKTVISGQKCGYYFRTRKDRPQPSLEEIFRALKLQPAEIN